MEDDYHNCCVCDAFFWTFTTKYVSCVVCGKASCCYVNMPRYKDIDLVLLYANEGDKTVDICDYCFLEVWRHKVIDMKIRKRKEKEKEKKRRKKEEEKIYHRRIFPPWFFN
jgi:hypothetical protein